MKTPCTLGLSLILAHAAGAQPGCADWRTFETIDPGPVSNILYDAAFTGRAAGLAVGDWRGSPPQPLIQEWDGQAWTRLLPPPTDGLGTMPMVAGAGLAGGALWVVGYVTTPYPTNNMPLVMRWDGSAWNDVQTPVLRKQNTYPFADRGGLAYDVGGVSEDDMWVVGIAAGYGDGSATSVGLALHFDGSTWEDVEVPLVGNRHHELNAVSASAPDNVWAVGDWRNIGQNFKALIVHWDGSEWRHVPNPGEVDAGGDAECVLAFAPDDVWVSGSFNGGADRLIHWNGSSWDVVDAGLPGPFAAMAANAPDDIWGSCAANATFYHFDGSSWSPAGSPEIPGSTYILRGWGLAALGPCEVWSVGAWSDGSIQRTLAERLTPDSCAPDFNGDGSVNTLDVLAFLNAWNAGDPRGDFNGDGAVNTLDVLAFLNAWNAGC